MNKMKVYINEKRGWSVNEKKERCGNEYKGLGMNIKV